MTYFFLSRRLLPLGIFICLSMILTAQCEIVQNEGNNNQTIPTDPRFGQTLKATCDGNFERLSLYTVLTANDVVVEVYRGLIDLNDPSLAIGRVTDITLQGGFTENVIVFPSALPVTNDEELVFVVSQPVASPTLSLRVLSQFPFFDPVPPDPYPDGNILLNGTPTSSVDIRFKAVFVAPLPITLVDFTARQKPGSVSLNWTTATEVDNSHFEVERSTDGRQFTTIGTVDGAGDSEVEQYYSFDDLAPATGTNYYRLRQVNFDNTASFSQVIAVNNEVSAKPSILVYPNPVTNRVAVNATGNWNNEVLTAQLIAADGRLVKSWNVEVGTSASVNLPQLSAGLYQLFVTDGTHKQTTRVAVR